MAALQAAGLSRTVLASPGGKDKTCALGAVVKLKDVLLESKEKRDT
jgi:hypothetical protein